MEATSLATLPAIDSSSSSIMFRALIRNLLKYGSWVGAFDGRRGYPSAQDYIELPLHGALTVPGPLAPSFDEVQRMAVCEAATAREAA